MNGSLQRVQDVMTFHKPDRIPLFDLLHNDAVLQNFNNNTPLTIGDEKIAIQAIVATTDSTRVARFAPSAERKETLSDGRIAEHKRWTSWIPNRSFLSITEYEEVKKGELASRASRVEKPINTSQEDCYQQSLRVHSWFGEDYCYLPAAPSTSIMAIYDEIGIEQFSYYMFDCENIIIEQMEFHTEYACRWIEGLPDDDPFYMYFIGDDIAFKSGPIFMPNWLQKHYFPRLKRVVDCLHAKNKKVLFHSDGNLNSVMDSLVELGVDALNPIEVAAGMNIANLHRRYPKLIFVGGIDVTELLPFGKPHEIKDAVKKAIDDSAGQILIGSTTEIHNEVPLVNFLAMREAAIEYEL